MGREIEDKIRVSCAGFASIELNGKYLLCLNKSQLEQGNQVLTPFGGALEYYPDAKPFLDNLGVEYIRETPDLRLFMERDSLDLFEIWFTKRTDREVTVDRELIEEMVLEEGIFGMLEKSEYTSEYIKTEKINIDVNDIDAFMYFEVFRVKFSLERVKFLFKQIASMNNIKLVSKEEILKGISDDGIKIGTNSKSIIELDD